MIWQKCELSLRTTSEWLLSKQIECAGHPRSPRRCPGRQWWQRWQPSCLGGCGTQQSTQATLARHFQWGGNVQEHAPILHFINMVEIWVLGEHSWLPHLPHKKMIFINTLWFHFGSLQFHGETTWWVSAYQDECQYQVTSCFENDNQILMPFPPLSKLLPLTGTRPPNWVSIGVSIFVLFASSFSDVSRNTMPVPYRCGGKNNGCFSYMYQSVCKKKNTRSACNKWHGNGATGDKWVR